MKLIRNELILVNDGSPDFAIFCRLILFFGIFGIGTLLKKLQTTWWSAQYSSSDFFYQLIRPLMKLIRKKSLRRRLPMAASIWLPLALLILLNIQEHELCWRRRQLHGGVVRFRFAIFHQAISPAFVIGGARANVKETRREGGRGKRGSAPIHHPQLWLMIIAGNWIQPFSILLHSSSWRGQLIHSKTNPPLLQFQSFHLTLKSFSDDNIKIEGVALGWPVAVTELRWKEGEGEGEGG